MIPWAKLRAWMLADMAKYLSQNGEVDAALHLSDQACQVVETFERDVELTLRRWDHASLQLQAGRSAEALAIFGQHTALEDESPQDRITVSLLRAEAHLAVGNRSEAHDWLHRALTDIDAYHVEFKRPGAERVAARF
jgi:hypothetical protein